MINIAKRIVFQLLNDKRSIGIMIFAPVLLITLIYFLLGDTNYKPTVYLDETKAKSVMGSVLLEEFENSLYSNDDIEFSLLPVGVDINSFVEKENADAVITFDGTDISIVMLEMVSSKISIISEAVKEASKASRPGTDMEAVYLVTEDISSDVVTDSAIPVVAMESGHSPAGFEDALKNDKNIQYISLMPETEIENLLNDKTVDAVVEFSKDGISIVMKEQDRIFGPIISESVRTAAKEMSFGENSDISLIFGKEDESTFDSLAYFLLSVISYFLIFLFAGISFVRERTAGTLERLMRTPVKSISVVSGYSLGFGFFAIIQSSIMILYSKFVIHTLFVGQWWLAMLTMLMTALVAAMMGIYVSIISKTEFQVVQFIPLLIIPQIFFSGLIPVDMLPYHLDVISYFMPLFYSGEAMRKVMVYGYGFSGIWKDLLILIGFIIVFFLANLIAVKKVRRS